MLIQHDRAGPNLPPSDYFFERWIRWPADQPGLNNRVLSLASGVDLQGERADMAFKSVGGDARVSRNGARLQARGFFEARASYLGDTATTIVGNENGTVSPSLLLLGLSEPDEVLRPRPRAAVVPTDGLVAMEAEDWDAVESIAKRVSGRTLIVEYPPDASDGWSRYWLRGSWPAGVPVESGLGVPGMVRGRRALALLLRPESFAWQATDVGRWGGANRWLLHGHGESEAVLFAWFATGTFVMAWALAQVMNEDRGPFVSELLVGLALSPAAIVLAGAAGRAGGLETWPVWIVLASIGLYGASRLLSMALRRTVPEAHPLLPVCLVGLTTMVLLDPLWSDFSGRFGRLDVDVPGPAVGALVAYLAGAAAFAKGRWSGRVLVATTLLWGATASPWWIAGHSAFLVLPAAALVAAEGLFRPALLLVLALLPAGLLRMARFGVAWNPADLLAFADERRATNLWWDAALLISFQWIGTLAFLGAVAMVGNRFLAYRLRRLLRLDPRLRVLPWAALATLALGITEPLALSAAPVVGFGALLVLAYEGLRANA